MALSRSIDDFGGVKADAYPVESPEIEISAAEDNRVHEDLAHLTRTSERAYVLFPTSTGANGPVLPTGGASHMGTGSAQRPTIAKVGTGLYDITYPSTFVDRLGVTEPIVFLGSKGQVKSVTVYGHVQTTQVGSVIHVAVFDGANALSDLTNGTVLEVTGR
jgi:hypothetical protein